VDQAPAITSGGAATFVVGLAGSFTLKSTAFPAAAFSVTSGSLPAGVTLVSNGNGTATLSGIPQVGTAGVNTFTITASNGVASVSQTFKLTVDQPPLITSAANVTFHASQANTFTVTTTGFPTALIQAIGPLPLGVTLVNKGNGTAILSGKPIAKGTFTFTIMATNGLLPVSFQAFTLTVS
jgi:hypothetical protein